jgi:H+/Cl- antiporter ClcA
MVAKRHGRTHIPNMASAALIAYLPQHISEVTGIFLGVCFAGFGIFFLATGQAPAPEYERLRKWKIRALGAAEILLGAFVAWLSFFTNAEGSGYHGSHWGDSFDIAFTTVWVLVLVGIMTHNIRQIVKYRRR